MGVVQMWLVVTFFGDEIARSALLQPPRFRCYFLRLYLKSESDAMNNMITGLCFFVLRHQTLSKIRSEIRVFHAKNSKIGDL